MFSYYLKKDFFVNMFTPDRETFRRLSGEGNLIPVYREILADTFTPVTAFLKLGGAPSFLLESVEGGEKWARYSFIGSRPAKVIRGKGTTVEIIGADGTVISGLSSGAEPIDVLKEELAQYRPVEIEGLPRFFGGLVGYLGYGMVSRFEPISLAEKEGLDMPDFFLMLTDTMLIFDGLRQKIKVVSNVHVADGNVDRAYDEAQEKIDRIIGRLMSPLHHAPAEPFSSADFSPNMTRVEFLTAVERAKEYVMAGDIVQVVLSQRFGRPTGVDPFHIYRALRVINPSPYMYYLDIGDAKIIGSSPEILVRLENGKIVLRPIAGTRPRGKTDEEDLALERELRHDPKEIAEHIMLVDLGRNDVGRVARVGSVRVTDLMTVERYSHVMHLVSNVEGDLREGLDAFDLLAACFPAGTVSGAPKVRAMEIIEELEPSRRGPYAGSVGYLSYSGNMDMCITIRTLVASAGSVSVQAGAGIVADSVAEKEYQETVNKAKGMMKAVDLAEAGLDGI